MPAATVIPAQVAARFSYFQLQNVAILCGTFLKLSTLKILPCPSARFSNYKIKNCCRQFPPFTNLSVCPLDFQLPSFLEKKGGGGVLLSVRVRV